MNQMPRLQRSRTDRMIAGVAAGVARYLNTDPAIVRLLFVLLAFSGPGLLVYPLLWLVMPREPEAPAAPGQVFVATGETQRLRIDPSYGAPGEPEQQVAHHAVAARAARALWPKIWPGSTTRTVSTRPSFESICRLTWPDTSRNSAWAGCPGL
jgi:phage shock protein PspC (stress-responsive transcriptional regulator)